MKTILFSPLALGTVVFVALGEPVVLWAAEPMRLMEIQMDAVTAGAVAVGMEAGAAAGGYNTYTHTTTSTTVISMPTHTNTVDIGLGSGTALACCGSGTDTNVQAAYYADGDRVIANSIVSNTRTPLLSFSQGVTTVIAVHAPSR
jgi:hypothetical protein